MELGGSGSKLINPGPIAIDSDGRQWRLTDIGGWRERTGAEQKRGRVEICCKSDEQVLGEKMRIY